jgi:hypothetical protein
MEALLMPLPAAIALEARELAELPGRNGMEYDERRQCAYWFTHQPGGIFVCVTFRYVPDLDAVAQLWTVLTDEDIAPSVERLLAVYRQATGIDVDVVPLQ